MSDEWVAECPLGWARSSTEHSAVAEMAGHIYNRLDPDSTVIVYITHCENFEGGAYGEVDAEEILEERTVEMHAHQLIELGELSDEMDILAEEAIMDGEELE